MNVTCHAPCLESSTTPSHMHFAMYEKLFLKQKVFILVLVKVRWTDSDKMLNHPSIILWTTLRYIFIWTDSDKHGGQPSEKNPLFKAMSCIHTRYARCPHAREMQKLLHGIYLFACMHASISSSQNCMLFS